jgi:hypothetical protein
MQVCLNEMNDQKVQELENLNIIFEGDPGCKTVFLIRSRMEC